MALLGGFTLMTSATWAKAARNVPVDLLLHLTNHQAQANKIASRVLKVTIMIFTV